MRWPGIEPGSTAWKATMLTIIPPSLKHNDKKVIYIVQQIKDEYFVLSLYKTMNYFIFYKHFLVGL